MCTIAYICTLLIGLWLPAATSYGTRPLSLLNPAKQEEQQPANTDIVPENTSVCTQSISAIGQPILTSPSPLQLTSLSPSSQISEHQLIEPPFDPIGKFFEELTSGAIDRRSDREIMCFNIIMMHHVIKEGKKLEITISNNRKALECMF